MIYQMYSKNKPRLSYLLCNTYILRTWCWITAWVVVNKNYAYCFVLTSLTKHLFN